MTEIKADASISNNDLNSDLKCSMIVEYIKDGNNTTTECVTEHYAMGYIFQGSCVIIGEDEPRNLSEGCIYLLERGRHLMEHRTGQNSIFEHIMIHFSADSIVESSPKYNPENERLERAVMSALRDNLSIEAMAGACFVSPSTFKRRFRARYSKSPHRWLLERKLDIAHRIITTTSIAIGEIATLCGFTNTSHFTSTFHNRFDLTPTQLRRMSRKKSEEDE